MLIELLSDMLMDAGATAVLICMIAGMILSVRWILSFGFVVGTAYSLLLCVLLIPAGNGVFVYFDAGSGMGPAIVIFMIVGLLVTVLSFIIAALIDLIAPPQSSQ